MRETTTSPWLRALPVILFLALLAGAAGSSLAVIHLREEAAGLAAETTRLRSNVSETTRLLQEMGAASAAAQQLEVLRVRVGNRLAQMTDKQTIWVSDAGVRPGVEASTPRSAPTAPAFPVRLASLEPVAMPGLLR
jgi:hypothetical protein